MLNEALNHATIAIVTDAPKAEDKYLKRLFASSTGQVFTHALHSAGLLLADCHAISLFDEPLPADTKTIFQSKKTVNDEHKETHGTPYPYAAVSQGQYVPVPQLHYLSRLQSRLSILKPNLVITLGNIATWALLNNSKLSTIRGTVVNSTLIPNLKVIPTYSPETVIKSWDLKSILIADLIKAKRESLFPEIHRPNRELWIKPELPDLQTFYNRYLANAKVITYDIETMANSHITCIGFAASATHAICVPFFDSESPTGNYWPDAASEIRAWNWVRYLLQQHPAKKLAQNGVYDMQWLWRKAGIRINNPAEDTMILHHAMLPEMPKSLGFLASIYTNEPAWKNMRKHVKQTEMKDGA